MQVVPVLVLGLAPAAKAFQVVHLSTRWPCLAGSARFPPRPGDEFLRLGLRLGASLAPTQAGTYFGGQLPQPLARALQPTINTLPMRHRQPAVQQPGQADQQTQGRKRFSEHGLHCSAAAPC